MVTVGQYLPPSGSHLPLERYAPPEEFVMALMACPVQGTHEYLARLRRLPTWWTLMLGEQSLEQVEARAALRRR